MLRAETFSGTTMGQFRIDGGKVGIMPGPVGSVGVGTTNPGTGNNIMLDVVGAIRIQNGGNNCRLDGGAGGTNVVCSSDIRLKKDIQPLESSLQKLLRIKGVTYRWKHGDESRRIGFIAQNVEEVYPELVSEEEDTGYKMLGAEGLIAPIVEAIRELYGLIQGTLSELAALKQSMSGQQEELRRLREEIERLRGQCAASPPR